MRYIFTISFIVLYSLQSMVVAQTIPPGYYDSAAGLTGEPLRTELMNIIDNHSPVAYSAVWTHFQTMDDEGGNQVWDIYSDNPSGADPYTFTFVSDQCGNYAGEGDCYNREHSVPSSWFNSNMPMYTDLFALYPTDGYVNGQRSSLPYGETNSPSFTSQNGSKVGNSSVAGYSGTVFEPIDAYKGDLARTYFYMMTRYKTQVSGWTSDMLSGDNMTTWAVNMMIDWSDNDPVSQKEIDRNEVIYNIQGNRNPYIDHPEWVRGVWWGINGIPSTEKSNIQLTTDGDRLFISFSEVTTTTMAVYDLTGREVSSSMLSSSEVVDPDIQPGTYVIHLTNEYTTLVRKVVLVR